MWRQNAPPSNRDSDEILSDEEELDRVTYDNDCTKKLHSLYSNEKKVQITPPPVSTQLASLTDKEKNPIFGSSEVNLAQRNSSSPIRAWKLDNLSFNCMSRKHGIQDDNRGSLLSQSSNEHHKSSCDDSISDEENAVMSKLSATSGAAAVQMSNSCKLESEGQHAVDTWSAIFEEAQELATFPKKSNNCPITSGTSEMNRGGRSRVKAKFSFRPMPHGGNLSWTAALKDGNGKAYKDATDGPALYETVEHKARETSVAELLGNLQEEGDDMPTKATSHDQRGGVPSMVELLENLQQKDGLSIGPPNVLLQNIKAKERKMQYGRKGISPHLGSRVLDNEDPPEFSGGGFSSEDEDNHQSDFCGATQKVKGHSMADLFQDAFNLSAAEGYSFPANKLSGIGYHGRLQQIIQIQKDRHLYFLKHSQIVQSPSNDSGFMDVQILSRFLEAKLTVCRCLLAENTNSFQSVAGNKCVANVGTERTIIFNSKTCDNVVLEAGSFVRIHPPWKEVQVREDERIFLCMYFSPQVAGS